MPRSSKQAHQRPTAALGQRSQAPPPRDAASFGQPHDAYGVTLISAQNMIMGGVLTDIEGDMAATRSIEHKDSAGA